MQWLNRNNKWVKSEENLPDTKKKQKKKKIEMHIISWDKEKHTERETEKKDMPAGGQWITKTERERHRWINEKKKIKKHHKTVILSTTTQIKKNGNAKEKNTIVNNNLHTNKQKKHTKKTKAGTNKILTGIHQTQVMLPCGWPLCCVLGFGHQWILLTLTSKWIMLYC